MRLKIRRGEGGEVGGRGVSLCSGPACVNKSVLSNPELIAGELRSVSRHLGLEVWEYTLCLAG
jgi:hypothetical protein